MPRLVLTPAAQGDLMGIAGYIESASGSVDAAQHFIDKLPAKCEKLAALPGTAGRERPELLPGLRSTPFGNYEIFFSCVLLEDRREAFEVVNILERHRDIKAHFRHRAK